MGRAKNIATLKDIVKVFRAEGHACVEDLKPHADVEQFADHNASLLVGILEKTPRPLAAHLRQAIAYIFKCDQAVAVTLSSAIVNSIVWCRSKKKNVTSGSKTLILELI